MASRCRLDLTFLFLEAIYKKKLRWGHIFVLCVYKSLIYIRRRIESDQIKIEAVKQKNYSSRIKMVWGAIFLRHECSQKSNLRTPTV